MNRLAILADELESTADKLSDIWIHLDAFARGEPFTRQMAGSILIHQKAPGWRDLTPEQADSIYAQSAREASK